MTVFPERQSAFLSKSQLGWQHLRTQRPIRFSKWLWSAPFLLIAHACPVHCQVSDEALNLLSSQNPEYFLTSTTPSLVTGASQNQKLFFSELVIDKDANWVKGADPSNSKPNTDEHIILFVGHLRINASATILVPPEGIEILAGEIVVASDASVTFSNGPVEIYTRKETIDSTAIDPVNQHTEVPTPAGAFSVDREIFPSTARISNTCPVVTGPSKSLLSMDCRSSGPMTVDDLGQESGSLTAGSWMSSRQHLTEEGAMNLGFLHLYKEILSQIQAADLMGRRQGVLSVLREARNLPEVDGASPTFKEASEISEKIIAIREKYVKGLLVRRIVLNDSSFDVPRSVSIFATGDSLDNVIEPNLGLVIPQIASSTDTLGLLSKDPLNDNQLVLHLSAELTSDALLSSLVSNAVGSMGEKFAGVSHNWDIDLARVPDGAIDAQATVAGNVLNLALTLDRRTAGIVIYQLESTTGLPLTFRWSYRSEQGVDSGKFTVSLSLQKAKLAKPLEISGNSIHNPGLRPIVISYVKTSAGRFVKLTPALVILPSGYSTIDNIAGAFTVPESAVMLYPESIADLGNAFTIVDEGEILETIEVKNLIPAHGPKIDQSLLHVDLEVSFEVVSSDGSKVTIRGQAVKLSPAEAEGSLARQSVIKPKGGKLYVLVQGSAFYENARLDIAQQRFDTSAVAITESMLPNIQ